MGYDLFLFDLDDTLLDFRASESLSFYKTLQSLGLNQNSEALYETYQVENRALWRLFELAQTTKEHLKVERFRKTFQAHQIDINPELASERFIQALPENIVLIEFAVEICEWLTHRGEIGIITNGIHSVATKRIKNSKLAPYISFTSVSETCGYAKPDVRFFENSIKLAKRFSQASTLVIGDRIETDILGAHNFGIDSCWFNPMQSSPENAHTAKYEIKHLSELQKVVL